MGRKSNKQIDLKKVELTEEENKKAHRKALLTILLCILWPFTLVILMPNIKVLIGDIGYYAVLALAAVNVYMTIAYTKSDVDDLKYAAFLAQNKIGNVERFAGLIFIVEVVLIGVFLFSIRKLII